MSDGHDDGSVTGSPKPADESAVVGVAVPFRCPHCGLDLADDSRTLRCSTGHAFDRAREGYVNLLVGGRLPSAPAGDDEAMIRARRAVFDAGAYAPIHGAVARAVSASPAGDGAGIRAVLDAGCGEGTYLAVVAARTGAAAHGIDVSKPAVRLAARRHRAHRYAVASSYRLPFADGVFDAVVDVFAPRPYVELARVLRPGGALIVVAPGVGHLARLVELIYDEPRDHEAEPDDWSPAGFERVEVETVAFTVELADAALRLHLLEMTPYWWTTTEERRATVATQLNAVDAVMTLTTFRRA
jgi:23S rRNA (guanine745-N1)-methyltransferase